MRGACEAGEARRDQRVGDRVAIDERSCFALLLHVRRIACLPAGSRRYRRFGVVMVSPYLYGMHAGELYLRVTEHFGYWSIRQLADYLPCWLVDWLAAA